MSKDKLLYFILDIINKALPFLMIPFITKHVSLSDYGQIELFTSTYIFFSFLISFGFEGWLASHYFKEKNIFSYIKSYLIFIFCFSFIIFVLFAQSSLIFSSSILISLTNAILFLVTTLLRLDGKFKYAGLVLLFNSALNVLLLYFYFSFYGANFNNRIYSLLLTYSTTFLLLFFILFYKYNSIFSFKTKTENFKVVFLFCLPLCISMVSSWIKGNVDKFYINSLLSSTELALYSLSFQVCSVMNVITITINKIIQPSFFKDMTNSISTKNKISYIILFIISGSLIYYIAINLLFPIIFDDRYKSALSLTPYLIFSFTMSAIVMILNNYFLFFSRTKIIMYQVIISSIFHCIFSFIFLQALALNGAVLAQLASSLISLFITIFFLKKITHA